MRFAAALILLAAAPLWAQGPASAPATVPSASRVIAELKARNDQLERENAQLKRELDRLKAQLARLVPPDRPGHIDIKQGMGKAEAERALTKAGWELQSERKLAGSVETRQVWTKKEGAFTLTRSILYGQDITIEHWEEGKHRNDP